MTDDDAAGGATAGHRAAPAGGTPPGGPGDTKGRVLAWLREIEDGRRREESPLAEAYHNDRDARRASELVVRALGRGGRPLGPPSSCLPSLD